MGNHGRGHLESKKTVACVKKGRKERIAKGRGKRVVERGRVGAVKSTGGRKGNPQHGKLGAVGPRRSKK